jgi:aspartyl-tRNA(Asn)/glutamyl-tRNA(Gln) amidotransferase subunit B
MLESGKTASEIIVEKGLEQISDSDAIADLVHEILLKYPQETSAYRQGKETVANWLFGQVMRTASGKANPQVVKDELLRQLKN